MATARFLNLRPPNKGLTIDPPRPSSRSRRLDEYLGSPRTDDALYSTWGQSPIESYLGLHFQSSVASEVRVLGGRTAS